MLGTAGQLVKNKFVTTMNLLKDFTLEFDLTLKGIVKRWGSVFHFTTGGNCCAHGQRIPAMWFRPGSKTFIVVDGTQSNGNAHNNHGSLTIGKKVSIKMKATRNSFDTYIDGKKTGSINRSGKDRKAWKNVKVCTFGFHSDRSSFAEGMRAGVSCLQCIQICSMVRACMVDIAVLHGRSMVSSCKCRSVSDKDH